MWLGGTKTVCPEVVRFPCSKALLYCFTSHSSRYWQVSVIMPSGRPFVLLRVPVLILLCFVAVSRVQAQGAKQAVPQNPISDSDADHIRERNEWFFRGRLVPGKPSADLRRRAYQVKLRMRAQHAAALAAAGVPANVPVSLSTGSWKSLGPTALPSDAGGNGTQDYRQVSGRATAIAIDPADSTGRPPGRTVTPTPRASVRSFWTSLASRAATSRTSARAATT